MAEIWRHMECFIFLLLMSILEEKQRAPYDVFLALHGVIHKVLICCSKWRFSGATCSLGGGAFTATTTHPPTQTE